MTVDSAPTEPVRIGEPQPLATVSGRYIFWMMAANFGVSMAFIVPIAFSLAVRIDALAPAAKRCSATSPAPPRPSSSSSAH